MTRSTFGRRPLTGRSNVAALHLAREVDGRRTVLAAPQPSYVPLWYPAGGPNTTARALLRNLEIYRTAGISGDARLLSAAGIARMVTPHTAGGGPGAGYGHGLGIRRDYHGVKLIQHGGGSKRIASPVLVAPERGYTAAALTNLAEMPADRLALAPLNQALGLPIDTPYVEYGAVTSMPELLVRYAGSYRGGAGTLLVASLQRVQLILRFGGQELVVRPTGDDGVVLPLPSGEFYIRFLLTEQGPARGIALGSRILPRYEGILTAGPCSERACLLRRREEAGAAK